MIERETGVRALLDVAARLVVDPTMVWSNSGSKSVVAEYVAIVTEAVQQGEHALADDAAVILATLIFDELERGSPATYRLDETVKGVLDRFAE